MKIIHCNVWGDIEISGLALKIIDTPEFQRLHYIKQNGFSYKVFPTATTSRFAHSIGVYHLTNFILDSIRKHQPEIYEQSKDEWDIIPLSGLCHDMGHGPFSHFFDTLCKNVGGHPSNTKMVDHESRSILLLEKILQRDPFLSQHQYEQIQKMLSGPKTMWYESLVHNPHSAFDLDKIDYLQRDVLQFGIRNGGVDMTRIVSNCRVIDNQLMFCERIRDEIENIFDLRRRMYSQIYLHPTVRRFEDQLSKYCEHNPLLNKTLTNLLYNMDFDVFISLTDSSFLELVFFSIPEKRDEWELRQWTSPKQDHPPFVDTQIKTFRDNIQYYTR